MLSTKTVIIGAGISGISAAVNLLKNGYDEFLIFEANDRIGGRCHTLPLENGVLEYGAQFIHGQLGNPIFDFARDNDLIDEEDFEITNDGDLGIDMYLDYEDFTMSFYNENKEKIPKELHYRINKILDDLILDSKKIDIKNFSNNESLGEYITDLLELKIRDEFPDKAGDVELRKIVYGFFDWRSKCENLISGCSSVFELSLKNFRNYVNCKGTQLIMLKNGYKSLIDQLIKPHEKEFYARLNLNHDLTAILLCKSLENNQPADNKSCEHCQFVQDKNKIVLKLIDKLKDNKETIVICDNVICTISLGVLKQNLEKLIQPSSLIPKEKLSAVSRLGFGTLNKIFLFYEKPFWTENKGEINLIRSYKDKREMIDILNHNYDNREFWFRDVFNFEVSDCHRNMLIAWMGGVHQHEELPDEQIVKDINAVLKSFLPLESIPNPVKIIRSKWSTNEYFRGSYSFCKIGGEKNDHELLSKPIIYNDKIFIQFAGEATSTDHFSTVHGAFMTGIRESNRILNKNQD